MKQPQQVWIPANHPYPLFHSWETLQKCHRLEVPLGLAKQRKKPGGTNISLLIRIPTQHWNRENELTKYGPKIVYMHPLHLKKFLLCYLTHFLMHNEHVMFPDERAKGWQRVTQ
jgi:hypothetical protein